MIYLAKIDQRLDYVPVVSTVTNLVNLFLKHVYIPGVDEGRISNDRFLYHHYLQNKGSKRCLLLLLPVVGNIMVYRDKKEPEKLLNFDIIADNITYLDLHEQHITSLPTELFQFTCLKTLGLNNNHLISLPSAIGLLTHLHTLNLQKNRLSELPAEFGKLPVLDELDLSINRFENVPREILPLTNLSMLDLGINRISWLPPAFRQLSNLTELSLADNRFNSFPPEILSMTNLKKLYLFKNNISSLPTEIGLLTRLEVLHFHTNGLTSLPKEIGCLTNLSRLILDHNRLTCLPREIGHLTNLEYFNLDYNDLLSLPTEIGMLLRLTQLTLPHNHHFQHLPMILGQLPELALLDITATRASIQVRNTILNQCRAMRDAASRQVLPLRLSKWEALAGAKTGLDTTALSDQEQGTLSEWLLRLEKTRDFAALQTELAQKVCALLADLPKKQEFRALFFNQAEANNACCEDRAAMSFNEIYTSWLILCKGASIKLLAGVARTLTLRKELQKLIPASERESVEIFLYYETKLRMELHLETAIQNMAYSRIGERSWIDEEHLKKVVREKYLYELIDIPVFESFYDWKKINAVYHGKLEALGERPEGDELAPLVLDHAARYGKILQELKDQKVKIAKMLLS